MNTTIGQNYSKSFIKQAIKSITEAEINILKFNKKGGEPHLLISLRYQ